jgi:Asp-tRNA(Asn)/Glu-tRNA(Gln) amidotransferase A subunit family amidase
MRGGRLSSVDLIAHSLKRIAEHDAGLHAFVLVFIEQAMAAAEAADAEMLNGVDRGPLHGIPIALKDIINIAGYPTTCGSRAFANNIPSCDAEIVTRLNRRS